MTEKHAADVLATMRQRFTSLNEIPVTQARITADEFAVLEAERDAAVSHQSGALGLVASIRWALGDNGQRMQDELIAWCRTLRAAEQERDALRAEVEALREDAERYRWLRQAEQVTAIRLTHYAFEALDAAIDAARKS